MIIGAGLSGIGAACHLGKKCPRRDFAVLEARDCIGGTWDLFRYPGVRSDSDMFTLGYSFRPWTETKSIAGGASILRYIHETAREHGIDRKIRFQHRVTRASWCSEEGRWIVQTERGPSQEPVYFSCTSCSCAPVTTAMQRAIRRILPALAGSKVASFTLKIGPTR